MRGRTTLGALAAAVTLLALPGASLAFFADPGGNREAPGAGIRFDQRPATAVVLQTPSYRLTISKQNGALLDLVDRSTGLRLIRGTNGCQWGAVQSGDTSYIGGCAFTPTSSSRFSYRWDKSAATLTMNYDPDPTAARPVKAVVTLHAENDFFDLRLTLDNRGAHVLDSVAFPADLFEDVNLVEAGYAPNFLPGVKLEPGFFRRVGNNVETYPSRWAFADYLALDLGGAHLSLYSVNPSPAPLAPVDLGFVRNASPTPCSNSAFCVVHSFAVWIGTGESWTSPVMRFRIGEPVQQSILDYRVDNGIDAYKSAAAKLGARLDTLARAPLVKADLEKSGVPSFRTWAGALDDLPSPALIHPVAFGPGGFDATDPDVLPPSAQAGTTADLVTAVDAAHDHGQLVMPYLNVSWWNPQSPTVQALPAPLTPAGIAVQTNIGTPATEQFSGYDGYIVSPSVPFVQARVRSEIERWGTDIPADCLFFDQIGARPWRRDFNPAASSPLSYDDQWLALFAPYVNRCLMVEDGWDRLAASFSGFSGSLVMMQREFSWLDERWGPNWETFPLALWLFHDKVLIYQHDLYPDTFTADPEVLSWNLAYGYMLSINWHPDVLAGPWPGIVAAFQKALGPRYAGVAMTGYAQLAPGVTRTAFGAYSVIANSTGSAYDVDGYRIAPRGFLARTDDGSLVAGAFAASSGTQYRIVEGGHTTFSVILGG